MNSSPFNFETTQLKHHPKTQFREIGDEIFLVHPDGEQMHNLNPMAAALWRLLEDPITAREMTVIVQSAFPIMAVAKIEDDIKRVLIELLTLGFIQVKGKS